MPESGLPDLAGLGVEWSVSQQMERAMTWETPKIEEIACGLEVTAYTPAEDGDGVDF